MSNEDIYAAYARAGLDYGPQFRRVATVARYGDDVTVGELDATGAAMAEHLPPPLLDGATHGLAALLDADEDVVSTRIDQLRVFKKPRADRLRTVMRRVRADDPELAFGLDVDLLEGDRPVAYLRGMGFTRLQRRVAAAPTLTPVPVASEPAGVKELIRTTVAALLSIEDPASIDDSATFLELGVDSLVAVDLAGNLGARLDVSLPSTSVFDHPSVEQLAEFIGTQQPQLSTVDT
jgi:acyl carrier protein